jgi:hypothetical protein
MFCLIIELDSEKEKEREREKKERKTCGHSLVVGEMSTIFSQLPNIFLLSKESLKQRVNRQIAGGDVSLPFLMGLKYYDHEREKG